MKKKKILILIFVFTLLAIISGITYAAFNFVNNASNNSIRAGQISMNYTEASNLVTLDNALPKTDIEGKEQTDYFDFSVMSNVDTSSDDSQGVKVKYEISISEDTLDQDKTKLDSDYIKIYLTKVDGGVESVVLEPTLISKLDQSEKISDAIIIYEGENHHKNNNGAITTFYRLRSWIDYETDISNWNTNGKYQYKFKVNISSSADSRDVDYSLAAQLKSMYTVANGTAEIDDDGNTYFKGSEVPVPTTFSEVLRMFGDYGLDIYRNKDGIYNEDLIEDDVKDFLTTVDGWTNEEYEEYTSDFDGLLNLNKAYAVGIAEDGEFLSVCGINEDELCTTDDIPSLQTVFSDPDTKDNFYNGEGDWWSILSKESFKEIYYNETNEEYDENLITNNVTYWAYSNSILYEDATEEEALAIQQEEKDYYVNGFGSIVNYIIAYATNNVVDKDKEEFIKPGVTLPTLKELFLDAEKEQVLVTNTYVRLNNMLWKIVGINSDDSVKLLAVDGFSLYLNTLNEDNQSYITSDIAKYLGFNQYEEDSGFMALIKDTTLGNLILKKDYKYTENDTEKNVNAYASLISKEEFENSIYNGYSYLLPYDEDRRLTLANINTSYYYMYYYTYYDGLHDSTTTSIDIKPIITIKNIEMIGTGTKEDPYHLDDEITYGEGQLLIYIMNCLEKLNFSLDWHYFNKLTNLYNSQKSVMNKDSLGISFNNKCYYKVLDEIVSEDYSGNCNDKIKKPIVPSSDVNENFIAKKYDYNTLSISAFGNNGLFVWQQKIGDKWYNINNVGTLFNELEYINITLYIDDDYSIGDQFRCAVYGTNTVVYSKIFTLNEFYLSDGEWDYLEINDSNKYKIIRYVGDIDKSDYFSANKVDMTKYDLTVPSVINGDLITTIDFENMYPYNYIIDNISKITFEDGIENIINKFWTTSYLNSIILPSSVKYIGDNVFDGSSLTSLTIKGKSSLSDFTYLGSNPWKWANGYSDSDIVFEP